MIAWGVKCRLNLSGHCRLLWNKLCFTEKSHYPAFNTQARGSTDQCSCGSVITNPVKVSSCSLEFFFFSELLNSSKIKFSKGSIPKCHSVLLECKAYWWKSSSVRSHSSVIGVILKCAFCTIPQPVFCAGIEFYRFRIVFLAEHHRDSSSCF